MLRAPRANPAVTRGAAHRVGAHRAASRDRAAAGTRARLTDPQRTDRTGDDAGERPVDPRERALGPPSGRGATAGSGHATSAFSSEAEAAPLLWEAATRTARARRVGDFLASTASGLALVLVQKALVATTPSQWADAVRGVVGGPSSASSATSPFEDGAGVRWATRPPRRARRSRALGSSRTRHRSRRHRHATRELPEVDAFGERDAGMMDSSGQWLAQLEERRGAPEAMAGPHRAQTERTGSSERTTGSRGTQRRDASGRFRGASRQEGGGVDRRDRDARPRTRPKQMPRTGAQDARVRHVLRGQGSTGDQHPDRQLRGRARSVRDGRRRRGVGIGLGVRTFRTIGDLASTSTSAWATARSDTTSPACAARRSGRTSTATSTPTTWSARTTSTSRQATWRRCAGSTGTSTPRAATTCTPMLVRYEGAVDKRGKYHRVVVDENYCNPPQVKRVEWHGGQRYVVPRNPYAAMFFLPAERYRSYVSKLEPGHRHVAAGGPRARAVDRLVLDQERPVRGWIGTPAVWSGSGTRASGSRGSPPRSYPWTRSAR